MVCNSSFNAPSIRSRGDTVLKWDFRLPPLYLGCGEDVLQIDDAKSITALLDFRREIGKKFNER